MKQSGRRQENDLTHYDNPNYHPIRCAFCGATGKAAAAETHYIMAQITMETKKPLFKMKPHIGAFPPARVFAQELPDLSGTSVGVKWFEARQFGFVIKVDGSLTEVQRRKIQRRWLRKLPDFILRDRARRKWYWLPFLGRKFRQDSVQDLEATFTL